MRNIPKPKKGTGSIKRDEIRKLKVKLQTIFNKYIVLRDKECITCSSSNFLQASHYFSVHGCPSVRYDEENAHAQCGKCHMEVHNKGGYKYAMAMLNKYGVERMDALLKRAHIQSNYSKEWLEQKINEYKAKINAINAS